MFCPYESIRHVVMSSRISLCHTRCPHAPFENHISHFKKKNCSRYTSKSHPITFNHHVSRFKKSSGIVVLGWFTQFTLWQTNSLRTRKWPFSSLIYPWNNDKKCDCPWVCNSLPEGSASFWGHTTPVPSRPSSTRGSPHRIEWSCPSKGQLSPWCQWEIWAGLLFGDVSWCWFFICIDIHHIVIYLSIYLYVYSFICLTRKKWI